jgi:hypothetical protein
LNETKATFDDIWKQTLDEAETMSNAVRDGTRGYR